MFTVKQTTPDTSSPYHSCTLIKTISIKSNYYFSFSSFYNYMTCDTVYGQLCSWPGSLYKVTWREDTKASRLFSQSVPRIKRMVQNVRLWHPSIDSEGAMYHQTYVRFVPEIEATLLFYGENCSCVTQTLTLRCSVLTLDRRTENDSWLDRILVQ